MISSLKGTISRIWNGGIEVEVGGVGYEVQCKVLSTEYSVGQEIILHIFTSMNDSSITLFGFRTVEELDLFKMLITVSGVGPKTAASIVAEKSALDIMKAIGDADVDFFKKIKGIGLKTAQRIIVDLKSKIGGLGELNLKDSLPLLEDDLTASLQQLGFERKEIEQMVKGLPKDLISTEEKLEWTLRNRR
jgi:holliday junction DNA helicase RuvA